VKCFEFLLRHILHAFLPLTLFHRQLQLHLRNVLSFCAFRLAILFI